MGMRLGRIETRIKFRDFIYLNVENLNFIFSRVLDLLFRVYTWYILVQKKYIHFPN